MVEDDYLSDAEIAELLGITTQGLRNKVSSKAPLPPRVQLPGCRHRLWPAQGFRAWVKQHEISDDAAPQSQPAAKRGRPRKGEVARKPPKSET